MRMSVDGTQMQIGNAYGTPIYTQTNCIDIDVLGGEIVTEFALSTLDRAEKESDDTAYLGAFFIRTQKPGGQTQYLEWSNFGGNHPPTWWYADVGSG